MNKNEALDLALEALEYLLENKTIHYTYRTKADEAITAIKQARALDKMAENARELGLDYEPAHVQPVAWLYREGFEALKAGKCWTAYGTKQDDNCNILVYLAAVAPKVEPAKAECDGFDSHPAAPVQKPDAMGCKCAECGAWQRWTPSGMVCKNGHGGASGINQRLYTTPPAQPAPVQPVAWGVFEGGNLHDMFFTKEEADNMAHLKGLHAEIRPLTTPPAAPVQEPVGDDWTPCMKLPVVVHVRQQRPGESHVSTREGITPVKPDDLIMRGVSGEEYPIGRKIFEQTYTLDTTPPAEPLSVQQQKLERK